MRDIGTNIRNIRIQKGITQEDLAERLYITRQAISSYETGRTRPDIDMIFKIADVLQTDTNTLLYGPQPTQKQQKAKRQLIIGIVLSVLLAAVYLGCNIYILSIPERYVVKSIPQNLIRITILPIMWYCIGWVLLHGLLMLPGMPEIRFKHQKKVFIATCIAFGLLIAVQLPYVIFYATALYLSLTRTYVNMVFPNIPIYTEAATWLIILSLRAGSGYAIWGAVIRFLRPNDK